MMQKAQGPVSGLGRILSETRIGRGLTLDDVERDTRIAKRYLEALEHEEFDVLPAPVYCRAFLRTYAQYLGLDAREILRLYPEKGREPEIAPLPQVSKSAPPALSMNWIIAGGVVALLLLAGILLYRTGDSGELSVPAQQAVATRAAEGAGAEAPNAEELSRMSTPTVSEAGAAAATTKVPDVRGKRLPDALIAIDQNGLKCVTMHVYSNKTPTELVISQSPPPGSDAPTDGTVTLTVSRGSS